VTTDAENIERFIGAIRDHNPVLVDGYAESLNFLATYVREGGVPGFSPKAIISSAQALPDNVRDLIEEGFHTTVYDKYGAREFSGIAYECEAHVGHPVGEHPRGAVVADDDPGAVFDRLARRLDLTRPVRLLESASIHVPTLVVHGRADPFFPVGNGEALAREIPGARLLVLERAATAIPDAAADEVAAAMLAL